MKLSRPLFLTSLLCCFFNSRISLALLSHQDAGLEFEGDFHSSSLARSRTQNKIFHPSTGLCVLRKSLGDPLKLGPCIKSDSWNYTPQKLLLIKGTYFCLQAVGTGEPVKLSINCTPSDSQWKMVSNFEKTYLATHLPDGTTVCLDTDSNKTLISNACRCLTSIKTGDYDSQWFKIVQTRRKLDIS